jgi:uncharacterized membrane protein YidH (DUF202 family)
MSDRTPADAERVFDAGLQPERTVLAWQRTVLALGIGVLAGSRLLLPVLGVISYVLLAVGLAAVLGMFVAVRRRYKRMHVHLTQASRLSLPHGALLPAALALVVGLSAVGALAFVVAMALR